MNPDDRFCARCGTSAPVLASPVAVRAPSVDSPHQPARTARALHAEARGYRDPVDIADLAANLLRVYIAFSALFAAMSSIGLYDPEYYVYSFPAAMDVLAFIGIPIFIAVIVLWLAWIFRINQNAVALGAERMTFGPYSAVAVQLVPILNFVTPLIVMRQTWKVAASPGEWRNQPPSPLIPIWWMLGLLTLVAKFSAAYLFDDFIAEDLIFRSTLMLDLFSIATDMIGAAAALAILGEVTAMQRRHAA